MYDKTHKDAETKIEQWLDRPEDGYSFDRIPDQVSGYWGSKNICDFTCFKYPNMYYIESKSTYEDRFDFNLITDYQMDNLLKKSQIAHVFGLIIILFITHKRSFILNIQDINRLIQQGIKSVNVKKIDKWKIPYAEIRTIPNNRKKLLDYSGELDEYVKEVIDHETIC